MNQGQDAVAALAAAGLITEEELTEAARNALNSLTPEEAAALVSAADKVGWVGPLPVSASFIPF